MSANKSNNSSFFSLPDVRFAGLMLTITFLWWAWEEIFQFITLAAGIGGPMLAWVGWDEFKKATWGYWQPPCGMYDEGFHTYPPDREGARKEGLVGMIFGVTITCLGWFVFFPMVR